MHVFIAVLLWILWILGGAFGLLLAFVVVSLPLDAIGRRKMRSYAWTDLESAPESRETLIVYLPGLLAIARTSSLDVIDVWQRYGDVMLVEYGRTDKFDPSYIIKLVVSELRDRLRSGKYKHLIFIGSSMGGRLAYDVLQVGALRYGLLPVMKRRSGLRVHLMLLDSPTSASDLYLVPPWAVKVAPGLIRILPFGPIWDSFHLISKIFIPPKKENLEPGVDIVELNRRVDEAKQFALSFWRDEVRYIVTDGEPGEQMPYGLIDDVVFVHSSGDDDTVRPSAFSKWAVAYPTIEGPIEVDSKHVAFSEKPRAWRDAFDVLLARLVARE